VSMISTRRARARRASSYPAPAARSTAAHLAGGGHLKAATGATDASGVTRSHRILRPGLTAVLVVLALVAAACGPMPRSGSTPAEIGAGTPSSPGATIAPLRPGVFAHPGILMDGAQLQSMRDRVRAGIEPTASAFARLQSSGTSSGTPRRGPTRFSSLSYVPAPVSEVRDASGSNEGYLPQLGLSESGAVEHLDDATASYTHALAWAVTGDERHARKAAEILDAWSGTLREIKFDQPRRHDNGVQVFNNGKLQAAWGAQLFTRAAEIIRHTWGGWPADRVQRYEALLRGVYLPLTITGWTNGANWLMSLAEATINIGVFTNDRTAFDAGVSMWRTKTPTTIYLTSDGPTPVPSDRSLIDVTRLRAAWYHPSRWIEGLQGETLRDLSHMSMGMGAMANAAETARIQGVDLWGEQRRRIVAAAELQAGYVNAYLDEVARRGGAQPDSSWRPPGWVGPNFSVGGVGFRAGWEVLLRHYGARERISMPQTSVLVGRLRPAGPNLHNAWETLTHGG
jgi:hypothetical protein